MGMAVTVDSAQSMTKTAAIYSLPDGYRDGDGIQRLHRDVAPYRRGASGGSDAAERKAIVKRQMLGAGEAPSRDDVVRNIATNLSRFADEAAGDDIA